MKAENVTERKREGNERKGKDFISQNFAPPTEPARRRELRKIEPEYSLAREDREASLKKKAICEEIIRFLWFNLEIS